MHWQLIPSRPLTSDRNMHNPFGAIPLKDGLMLDILIIGVIGAAFLGLAAYVVACEKA